MFSILGVNLGVLWKNLRGHFESTLGSIWKYPRDHFWSTLGSLWNYRRVTLGGRLSKSILARRKSHARARGEVHGPSQELTSEHNGCRCVGEVMNFSRNSPVNIMTVGAWGGS